jgi:ABC-type uncharacterized transport system auxiliary subunit
MNPYKNLGLLFAIVVLLSSCAGEQIITKYYILDSPTSYSDSLLVPYIPCKVRINPFSISEAYNQLRIALKTRSHELNYYYYNNWADNPADAIRYFSWKRIKDSGLFEMCELRLTDQIPDLYINANIHQIERMDLKKEHAAHLNMTFELLEVKTGRSLVIHEFDRSETFDKASGMNVFAESLSRILARETDLFLLKIITVMNSAETVTRVKQDSLKTGK